MVYFVFNFHCWFRFINWFFIVTLTFISTGRNLSTLLLGLNIGIDFCKGSTLFWNMLFILQIVFNRFLVYSKLNISVDKVLPRILPFCSMYKICCKTWIWLLHLHLNILQFLLSIIWVDFLSTLLKIGAQRKLPFYL